MVHQSNDDNKSTEVEYVNPKDGWSYYPSKKCILISTAFFVLVVFAGGLTLGLSKKNEASQASSAMMAVDNGPTMDQCLAHLEDGSGGSKSGKGGESKSGKGSKSKASKSGGSDDQGDGFCLDDNDNPYDGIVTQRPAAVADDQGCFDYCEGLPLVDTNALALGFELGTFDDVDFCACRYNNGALPDGFDTDDFLMENDVFFVNDVFDGTGPIEGVDGTEGVQCFPIERSDDQGPFELEGVGFCQDAADNRYDGIVTFRPDAEADRQGCFDYCEGLPLDTDALGFELGDGCLCLYNNGALPEGFDTDDFRMDNDVTNAFEGFDGTGSIVGADGTAGRQCFSIERFELVGVGSCEDDDNAYDFIATEGADAVANAQGCFDYCEDLPGFKSNGVGFELDSDFEGEVDCNCLYDDGTLPDGFDTPDFQEANNVDFVDDEADGTGPIVGSAGIEGIQCFRVTIDNVEDADSSLFALHKRDDYGYAYDYAYDYDYDYDDEETDPSGFARAFQIDNESQAGENAEAVEDEDVTSEGADTKPMEPLLRGRRRLGKDGKDMTRHLHSYNPHPYLVSIGSDERHHCAGTLITKNAILTAAHCFANHMDHGNYQSQDWVEINRQSLTKDNDNVIRAYIDNDNGVVLHDHFDWISLEHDFALVFLSADVDIDHGIVGIDHDNVRTIKLNANSNVPRSGDDLEAVGWGLSSSDPFANSEESQEVKLEYVSSERCMGGGNSYEWPEGRIKESMLCAYKEGVCNADQGGPIIKHTQSGPVQVGITSFVAKRAPHDCITKNYPQVYARISDGHDWIKKTVCARTGDLCPHASKSSASSSEESTSTSSKSTKESTSTSSKSTKESTSTSSKSTKESTSTSSKSSKESTSTSSKSSKDDNFYAQCETMMKAWEGGLGSKAYDGSKSGKTGGNKSGKTGGSGNKSGKTGGGSGTGISGSGSGSKSDKTGGSGSSSD